MNFKFETSEAGTNAPQRAEHIQEIYGLIGENAVLLPCPSREKGPRRSGWNQTTLEETKTPEYQNELARESVAVLLGKPSGDLCAIDLDNDAAMETFLALNPKVKRSLQTKGEKGGQIWVRVLGEYPAKVHKFTDAEKALGEWRGDGCSMIHGVHPNGRNYRYLVKAKPIEISFAEINWPDEWRLPWKKTAYEILVEKYGRPFQVGIKGSIKLNEGFFRQKYQEEHAVLWSPETRQFYEYDGPKTGLWKPVSDERMKAKMVADTRGFAIEQEPGVRDGILTAATNRFGDQLVNLLKGDVERPDAFGKYPNLIHTKNGMLLPNSGDPILMPFWKESYSRNLCPVEYVPAALCPKFKQFLEAVLDQSDIDLLQRMFGYALSPGNDMFKIFLLTGVARSGKSTLLAVLEKLVGPDNVGQLRTENLNGRFEAAGFCNKRLLTGPDVPRDFLQAKAVGTLKSLVGGDRTDAEFKNRNERVGVTGNFNVVVTSNHRLVLLHSEDPGAWASRLISIEFTRPVPGKAIRNYADILFKEEGAGILNWAIAGLVKGFREKLQYGDFVLTPAQQARIDNVVGGADSLRRFLQDRVEKGQGALSTEEIQGAYSRYCEVHGWSPIPYGATAKCLQTLMMELFEAKNSHSLECDGNNHRGYRGVGWRNHP